MNMVRSRGQGPRRIWRTTGKEAMQNERKRKLGLWTQRCDHLVARCTADTPSKDRWRNFSATEAERHATDVGGAEVGGALVDGGEGAEKFISRLLPLCD